MISQCSYVLFFLHSQIFSVAIETISSDDVKTQVILNYTIDLFRDAD